MRSGSRAMVKRKRPSAGPKAMKVHPKKTASVMAAGPGTRDGDGTRRLGPARPRCPLPPPPPFRGRLTSRAGCARAAAAGSGALGRGRGRGLGRGGARACHGGARPAVGVRVCHRGGSWVCRCR